MYSKQKITRKDGSAMTLAIILTALLIIISSVIMSQINNQIRSNGKMYKEAQDKYIAEGNIEEQLSEIYLKSKTFIEGLQDTCGTTNTGTHNHTITSAIIHGGKAIQAQITVNVTKDGNKYTRTITNKKIDFKDVQIESIVNNYKVTTILDFSLDSSNNLNYSVKSYNKQPINQNKGR